MRLADVVSDINGKCPEGLLKLFRLSSSDLVDATNLWQCITARYKFLYSAELNKWKKSQKVQFLELAVKHLNEFFNQVNISSNALIKDYRHQFMSCIYFSGTTCFQSRVLDGHMNWGINGGELKQADFYGICKLLVSITKERLETSLGEVGLLLQYASTTGSATGKYFNVITDDKGSYILEINDIYHEQVLKEANEINVALNNLGSSLDELCKRIYLDLNK